MPDRIRLAIALCALFLSVGCQSQEEQRAEHAARAAEYFDAEQWNEAKIEYLNLLQLTPDDGEANFRLGEVQRRLGEYADALWRYREAVRLAPGNAEWRARLAAMLIAGQRIDEAADQVDAALEIDPANAEALLIRARIHGHRAELDLMIERLDVLLELTREVEDEELRQLRTAGYALKVQAHLQRQEPDEAEKTLRAFVAAEDKPGPHLLLAVFLVDRDRADEAQVEYRAAIDSADTENQRLRAQFAMAGFLNGRGQADASEQVLKEAHDQAPEREEPLLQLATFYQSHGRTDEAVVTLEKAAATRPGEAMPWLVVSDFHRQTGNPDKALEAVERALELEPELERARLMRAEYLMAGRAEQPELADEANAIVAEVLEENPDSLLGLLTSGKFLLLEGRNEDAANTLRRVVQEQPSTAAHLMLATAYRNMRQPDLARSELLAAIQLQDSNLVARQMLAHIYFEGGNYGLAVQESEAALRRKPDLVPMSLLRAQALGRMGQGPEARKALDEIEFGGEEHDELRLRAAAMYYQLELADQATAHVSVVLERDPANAGGIRLLVTTLTREGKADEAMAKVEQALAIKPDDAQLYELRAAVTLAKGKGAPADQADALADAVLADLDISIQKAPDRAEPHILRGRILQ
ncbi:MAG: tetratricopeptide repeat protein, partial [Deltaproteobacteria bacterium]|nr:tetratricopeptide repeat protein [Deltaproteobacteria bacterium]